MNGTELQDRLTSYLRLREALGISLGSESKVLKDFIDFAGTCESAEPITSLMVFNWLDATSKQHLGNARRRLGVVRQFLLHLSASLPDTQVPEFRLLCGRRRPTPFVFSPEQKQLLLQEAMEFSPGTFFSTVLHTVLGLISVTGLRASEAIGLDRRMCYCKLIQPRC
jgi:integrase/recombinase XerD